jgi:UDP-N-acetylmuramyl pentapeptide phosphotransferase/UDP-N-acetylglucosamine-1-phosphate transferase
MFFNYPFGKIFLGDLGAYSLGLVVSMLTIILFGRHPEISPWAAVLILIYPAIEVSFSLLRRILGGSSAFDPDMSHLHLRLFNFFRAQPILKNIANSFVTIALTGLWIFPSFIIPWVYHKPFFIWIAIFGFVALYGGIYLFIPNAKKITITGK